MKSFLKRLSTSRSWTGIITLMIVAFALGYFMRGDSSEKQPESKKQAYRTEVKAQVWTCSMHPQIRLPKPGKCPICGMELIPVTTGGETGAEEGPRTLKLTPHAVKLAEIQVAPVERKFVTAEIRTVGKIDYDETRLAYITAWVPGRIDRLFVDFTGVHVKKNEHMVYLYSPELYTAQEELIQALQTVKSLKRSKIASIRKTALQTVDATREKLRLLGLTKEQIDRIEKSKRPSDHITIYSPIAGTVIHKNGLEGMYVNTGTKIYTIADLSHLWVKLDAYESDLAWLKYGQKVEFQTEAYPGEVFRGRIAFIDPVINTKTRTAKVRVNVSNQDGRLKPEMFVHAVVRTKIGAGGKVIDSSLSGKWVCPMHPEIIKNSPGKCNICGMHLVASKSLGFIGSDAAKSEAPLVIPASAPLITGKRAVVYIKVPGKDGVYEGRVITLGPRAGDYYLVKDGLHEGELVVVNGNFKIDSAIQILAKPSMMNPEGGGPMPGHHHGGGTAQTDSLSQKLPVKTFSAPKIFKKQLGNTASAYLFMQQALSHDNLNEAQDGAKKFLSGLNAIDMSLLKDKAHMDWMQYSKNLKTLSEKIKAAPNIASARSAFIDLSDTLYESIKAFSIITDYPLYRFYCPMARNNKGAYWLQNKTNAENPFFGSKMFTCGTQVEVVTEGNTDF